MYMVRFNGTTEAWATKLTDTSATLPGYSTSPTAGGNVVFIWSEYAHNGRIAFDGTNYAGYFGAAITVPGQACVGASTRTSGVNIHQGDRMKAVSGAGALLATPGFSFGCSHSGYERIVWDPAARAFVTVCKNDAPTAGKSGKSPSRPARRPSPRRSFVRQIGNVMPAAPAAGTGSSPATSAPDSRPTPNGLADIHLFHVAGTASAGARP